MLKSVEGTWAVGVNVHINFLSPPSDVRRATRSPACQAQDDAGLQEKLKGAADLDGAVALAKEAGFDVSQADWLKYQAKETVELTDEELESVAGGCFYASAGSKGKVCAKMSIDVCPDTHWNTRKCSKF
jgi:predicted ribosomally synthesized peptide with nif11-like leader